MTNAAWIEWFQVVASLGLTIWMCAMGVRVRRDLNVIKDLREDVRGRVGDPYRTPAERVHLPIVKDPVYCADCRFMHETEDFVICLAMPTQGEYLLIGQPETNENHDCAHFQKKTDP